MQVTKLNAIDHNVHAGCDIEDGTGKRVQGDIDIKVFNYFFRHVLCYQHGSQQALVNFFFQRLYEECQELGIPPVWDETDYTGERIVAIVNRLNFKDNGQSVSP